MFRKCPEAGKRTKSDADRIFPPRKEENKSSTGKTPADKSTSFCSASVQDVKGLFQGIELNISSK